MGREGWTFNKSEGSTGDEINGKGKLSEIYLLANPRYSGRVSVPVLWDKKRKTIVNNESADILRMNGIDIDIGPTRHGITRGHTIYFFDPVGNRNEVFTGGYRPDPDFPSITWTEDQFGRGLFYYENVISQRFLSFHT